MLRKVSASAVARVRLFHTSPVVKMDAGGPSQEQLEAERIFLAAKAQKKQDQERLLCKLSCFAHNLKPIVMCRLSKEELKVIDELRVHHQTFRNQEHSELVSRIQTKMSEIQEEYRALDLEKQNLITNLKRKFAQHKDRDELIQLVLPSKEEAIDEALRKKNQAYNSLNACLQQLKGLKLDSTEFCVEREQIEKEVLSVTQYSLSELIKVNPDSPEFRRRDF